jgi:hypothetical protein
MPLLHLGGQALRHQRLGLVVHHVEDGGAVGPRLFAHGINGAESFRYQETGPGALAFEQRIGADGSAVAEIADIGARYSGGKQNLDPGKDGARWIIRRRS